MSQEKLGIDVSLLLADGDSIQVINEWAPGGAETYVSDFLVVHQEAVVGHFIAKACIRMCPKETMDDWLKRRTILQSAGVSVPGLYIVDNATLVEEFIPHTFIDAYRASDEQNKALLESNFVEAYKRIRGAGFKPVSFHDIRSRGG